MSGFPVRRPRAPALRLDKPSDDLTGVLQRNLGTKTQWPSADEFMRLVRQGLGAQKKEEPVEQ